MPKKRRDASGRFLKGPSQGQLSRGKSDGSEESASSDDDATNIVSSKSSPRGRKRSRSVRRGFSTHSEDPYESQGSPEPAMQRSRKAEFLKEGCGEDKELEGLVLRAKEARAYTLRTAGADALEEKGACALRAEVVRNLEIVEKVALGSRSLKGTTARSLKDAASAIKEAFVALSSRTVDEEVERLQADNTRLQAELTGLREEFAGLREELRGATRATSSQTQAPQGSPSEEMMRAIMVQVGTMVNARVDALEGRLPPEPRLRPPLEADKRRSYAATVATTAPALSERTGPATRSKAKSKDPRLAPEQPGPASKKAAPYREPGPATSAETCKATKKGSRPTPATSQAMSGEWQVVGEKKKAKKKKKKAAKKKRTEEEVSRRKKVSLRAPRSSAVVLTLRPGAEERGATYAKVLAEAKSRVNLQELGIDGLRFRAATTGARILEIPGATSGDKADSLATKLRESLTAEDVMVSRPTKCAELRIVGLDDSTSKQEVVSTLAAAGGCSPDSIRSGEIRRDRSGMGSLWLSCPVTAAKKVVERGRILVGWVSAQVKLLEPRPMRCFKCLLLGHVGARCPTGVDRSNLCYHCGKPGHLASQCSESKPHCAICSAAGKPAEHRLGGKGCSPPWRQPLRQATVASGPSKRPHEVEMDTAQ